VRPQDFAGQRIIRQKPRQQASVSAAVASSRFMKSCGDVPVVIKSSKTTQISADNRSWHRPRQFRKTCLYRGLEKAERHGFC
jgi:hypothetical protein